MSDVYMATFDSLEIKTSGSVYRPAEDTYLAARAVSKYLSSVRSPSLRVLDLGTGTGALGIFAATSGKVSRAVFADINPEAVRLARQNLKANNNAVNAECEFVRSNLFSNVNGKFDLIIFNAPYLPSVKEKKDTLSKAWDGGDEGIGISIDFLKQARSRLKRHGRIILVASSHANVRKLRRCIKGLGYSIKSFDSESLFFEHITSFMLSQNAAD